MARGQGVTTAISRGHKLVRIIAYRFLYQSFLHFLACLLSTPPRIIHSQSTRQTPTGGGARILTNSRQISCLIIHLTLAFSYTIVDPSHVWSNTLVCTSFSILAAKYQVQPTANNTPRTLPTAFNSFVH
jgi:hypothetical protein